MLNVYTMVSLSTAHLTKATLDVMGEYADPFEYGFYYYVSPDFDIMEDGPPDLAKVHRWALDVGYSYIKFDADANMTPDLPKYNED
jgi:hypothetical protein